MKNDWQPNAAKEALEQRAHILTTLRQFFAERGVLEVDTPLLSHATVTDPHVMGIPVPYQNQMLYLQTSPEYAMKRLLANGSGPIYQICKAFRQGDLGKLHNPEFTMLEWYRPGFDHHDLMDEMDVLLQIILKTPSAERLTYADMFKKFLGINPHLARLDELIECAAHYVPSFTDKLSDGNAWLDLLMTHCIEPQLGKDRPLFIYDFPISQAALAKIRQETPPVASRFEVYFKGIELANGFHELQQVEEQRKRFQGDLAYRTQHGLPLVPLDERFLASLQHGIPDCSGVALGIDRLVMLALGKTSLSDVMSFVFERA